MLLAPLAAPAHPQDEFCLPGEAALDPALCAALAALDSGERVASGVLLDAAGQPLGGWSSFGRYVVVGVRHILPAGLDHMLFVLALFLSSPRLSALIAQISTFTVAHTATLGLASAGILSPQAAVVEPLIAASIVLVAVENLWLTDVPRWRLLIVFAFGLIHGMGFAGFFAELGLPPEQFLSGLIGFNVGVEIGQLSVVSAALLAALAFRRSLADSLASAALEARYRRWVRVPLSAAIAAIGLFWAIERSLAALGPVYSISAAPA